MNSIIRFSSRFYWTATDTFPKQTTKKCTWTKIGAWRQGGPQFIAFSDAKKNLAQFFVMPPNYCISRRGKKLRNFCHAFSDERQKCRGCSRRTVFGDWRRVGEGMSQKAWNRERHLISPCIQEQINDAKRCDGNFFVVMSLFSDPHHKINCSPISFVMRYDGHVIRWPHFRHFIQDPHSWKWQTLFSCLQKQRLERERRNAPFGKKALS